jgi:hypothetical protein
MSPDSPAFFFVFRALPEWNGKSAACREAKECLVFVRQLSKMQMNDG